jgi:methylenetetrahydrofolate dehydrogenase (NADP+)/methenyltetrahydrofolate cyclohydrolase
MTAKLIKGTEIREVILEEVKSGVEQIKEKHGVVPGLVTILVGENPASISYVTLKIKTAERLGFKEIQDSQPEDISEADLLALVDKYNKDDAINGILVQLPLPKHINEKKVLNAIDPDKDVDGFHPVNVGRLMIGGDEVKFPPCRNQRCRGRCCRPLQHCRQTHSKHDVAKGSWRQLDGHSGSHPDQRFGRSL